MVALRRQERVRHAAPDDQRVDLGGQHLQDCQLVGHLGAPDDGDERPRRTVEEASQHFHLSGEAQARRAGQEVRRPHDGGVAAVRRAERLVHVGVIAPDHALHEGGVVRLLARVEPQVVGERHARAEGVEPPAHGVHLPPWVALPRRPAQVRRRGHLGAVVEEPLQRRERGGDAEVVGHGGRGRARRCGAGR